MAMIFPYYTCTLNNMSVYEFKSLLFWWASLPSLKKLFQNFEHSQDKKFWNTKQSQDRIEHNFSICHPPT